MLLHTVFDGFFYLNVIVTLSFAWPKEPSDSRLRWILVPSDYVTFDRFAVLLVFGIGEKIYHPHRGFPRLPGPFLQPKA